MKVLIVIMSIIFTLNMVAQEDVQKDSLEYQEKNTVEYSNYFNEIKLNSHLYFKQDMQTRIGGDYAVFEFPLLLKYNIAKKVSILIGPKIDLYTNTKGMLSRPSLYTTFGIQYDVDENFIIEAKFNYQLTDDMPFNNDYTFGSKNAFTLGSKFRF
ncbi:hypothetical protein [Mariniflexile sp.]|uniref:hypothetical protein n=1 Tax=Mariniflexile sp. TaxID=1979402 RepID=UPI0040481FE8